MAIFTAAELAVQKTAWKAALAACSGGQSYDMGGRALTRVDVPEIRSTLEWLDKLESNLAAGSCGPQMVTGRPAR